MVKLTLLRHGESLWNHEKRFTGWTDVALTARGVAQAQRAGALLAAHGFAFDVCFTSTLRRATDTLRIVLEAMGTTAVPVHESWRLNERHYGALQGLTRWEAMRRYGARRMLSWQRTFTARPPALESAGPPTGADFANGGDGQHPSPAQGSSLLRSADAQASPDPGEAAGPGTALHAESLADTLARLLPLWEGTILPELRREKRVLVVSHHNTLRVLVKYLDRITDAGVVRVHIPTGKPLVYEIELEGAALRAIGRYYITRAPGRRGPAAMAGG